MELSPQARWKSRRIVSGYNAYASRFRYDTVNTNATLITDCAVKNAPFPPPKATLKKVGLSTISSVCLCVNPWYRRQDNPVSASKSASRSALSAVWSRIASNIMGRRFMIFNACRISNGTCCGTRNRRGGGGPGVCPFFFARARPASGKPGNAFRNHSTAASMMTCVPNETHLCFRKLSFATPRLLYARSRVSALVRSENSRNKIAPNHTL